MRTYSGFLILEDLFNYIPTTNQTMYQFSDFVMRPKVNVVETDCLTKIGEIVPTTYEIEGEVELATDMTLTKARLDFLLGQGQYTIALRNSHSCVSQGGICSKCYHGTYIDQPFPAVNTPVIMDNSYDYQTDVLQGDGSTKNFTLTQTPDLYDKILLIFMGMIVTTGFTITGTTLTLDTAPPLNSNLVVRYYKHTTQPFMGYLAKSYSGSLLGMSVLPTDNLHLRSGLMQQLLGDSQLEIVKQQLEAYKIVTSPYINYIDTIKDKLEKALYLLAIYGIFANVSL